MNEMLWKHNTYMIYNFDIQLKYNFVETPRKFIIAIINLRAVFTKLYFNLIFTMQTYKERNFDIVE